MATEQTLDFSVDILRSILWQYDRRADIVSLLKQKQDWYDQNQSAFWSDWVTTVFDLRTANTFGLRVWSIILGLPLQISNAPSTPGTMHFGFGAFRKNFNNGNFGSTSSTSNMLTDDQARIILRLRYWRLIGRCTVTETNRILADVFSSLGPAYVLDDNAMNITFVFGFVPDTNLRYVLDNFDVLPRPATVAARYIIQSAVPFGFGHYNLNFNNGSFGS